MSSIIDGGVNGSPLNINSTSKDKLGNGDVNDVESTAGKAAATEETARVVDHHAEQALCRKFDYRLLPVLALMCNYPFTSRTLNLVLNSSSRFIQCARQRKLGKCSD
jgi:hypothetical protein